MESSRSSSSVPWTRRNTLRLISLLKLHSVLWLPGHRDYMKYNVREQAYKDIALELHKTKLAVTICEIRKKIHTLRSQYARQVNTILEQLRRFGVARQPSLWCFDELSFLWSICAPGVGMPNLLEQGTEQNVVGADNNTEGDDSDQADSAEYYKDIRDGDTACIVTVEPANLPKVNDAQNKVFRSKKILWNRKQTKKLIEYYKQNELLWNPTHPSYDDHKLRDVVTAKIATQLSALHPGIISLDVKVKLHTIRSQYSKQLRNIELQNDISLPQRPTLWCFKQLSFLWPICTSGEYPMPMLSAYNSDDNGGESNIDSDDSSETIMIQLDKHDELLTNKQIGPSDIDYNDLEIYDTDDDRTLNAAPATNKPNANRSVEVPTTNTAATFSSIQRKLSEPNLNNFKCRFKWLGEHAVSTINGLKNEEVIYETVNTIEKLLETIRTMDAENCQCKSTKTYQVDLEQRPPQRRNNRAHPKLSHFNCFDVRFDLGSLCLNDINVKVINQSIVIEGVYKPMSFEDQVPKRFRRYYELPNGFDLRSVSATISADGVLRVNANKKTGNCKREHDIQIKRIGASKLYRND